MKTSDFSFELPEELIAQTPPEKRGDSRLLVIDRYTGALEHSHISCLADFLDENCLVVVNDSRVRKARIYGTSESGGRVEFLLLENRGDNLWLAMVTKAKKQKPGKRFVFDGGLEGQIEGVEEPYRLVRFDSAMDDGYLERHGHIPLPPYIRREDSPADARRYQTVYSEKVGSVAAPTAGLHLTDEILAQLEERTAGVVRVTLHVGLGTFLPVRAEQVSDHTMHAEHYGISPEAAERINRARREGKKIVAVGTTSGRTLESAFRDEENQAGEGATDIFIYPGYCFQVVNTLLTNFHTPESSLIMLVSAFAGRERIMEAYAAAVKERYRFFSYGDATLIRG